MNKSEWVWMPHAAHFICAHECQFKLATYVGKYIVSTVGEYWPDSRVREIIAKVKGISVDGIGDDSDFDYMRKIGFSDIGFGRKYETMVFVAEKSKEECCPWSCVVSLGDKDFLGYNDPAEAFKGHLSLCEKWTSEE